MWNDRSASISLNTVVVFQQAQNCLSSCGTENKKLYCETNANAVITPQREDSLHSKENKTEIASIANMKDNSQ